MYCEVSSNSDGQVGFIDYDLKGLCHDVWSHFKSVKDVFKSIKTLNNSVCLRETGRFYARDVKVTGGDNSNKR